LDPTILNQQSDFVEQAGEPERFKAPGRNSASPPNLNFSALRGIGSAREIVAVSVGKSEGRR